MLNIGGNNKYVTCANFYAISAYNNIIFNFFKEDLYPTIKYNKKFLSFFMIVFASN